jgi:hypothetical protein
VGEKGAGNGGSVTGRGVLVFRAAYLPRPPLPTIQIAEKRKWKADCAVVGHCLVMTRAVHLQRNLSSTFCFPFSNETHAQDRGRLSRGAAARGGAQTGRRRSGGRGSQPGTAEGVLPEACAGIPGGAPGGSQSEDAGTAGQGGGSKWKVDFAVTCLRLFVTSRARSLRNPPTTFHFPLSRENCFIPP